jgi:hypothetical protein
MSDNIEETVCVHAISVQTEQFVLMAFKIQVNIEDPIFSVEYPIQSSNYQVYIGMRVHIFQLPKHFHVFTILFRQAGNVESKRYFLCKCLHVFM